MTMTADFVELKRRGQLYAYLMGETKWRLDAIFQIEGQLGKSLNALPHFIANETYLLQLRMVFESIALGCMIVHGDAPISGAGKLTKFYQADVLLKALSDAHRNFFPIPISFHPNPLSPEKSFFPERQGAFLTKEEVIRLYRRYGEFLHRGKISSFVEKQQDALKPLGAEIGDVARKLRDLLHPHKVHLHGSSVILVCTLHPVTRVAYFEADEGSAGMVNPPWRKIS